LLKNRVGGEKKCEKKWSSETVNPLKVGGLGAKYAPGRQKKKGALHSFWRERGGGKALTSIAGHQKQKHSQSRKTLRERNAALPPVPGSKDDDVRVTATFPREKIRKREQNPRGGGHDRRRGCAKEGNDTGPITKRTEDRNGGGGDEKIKKEQPISPGQTQGRITMAENLLIEITSRKNKKNLKLKKR